MDGDTGVNLVAGKRSDEVRITDPELATRIKDMVMARLAEREDAVREEQWGGDHAGIAQIVFAESGDHGAEFTSGPGQHVITVVRGEKLPASWIVVEGEVVILRGGLAEADLEECLADVATYHLSPADLTPYGYVNSDGQIVTIFFMWPADPVDGDERHFQRGSECYVLENHTLPTDLFFERDVKGGGGWFQRFWEMVDDGRLIHLTQRIRELPGDLLSVCSTDRVLLVLHETDDLKPVLPTGRYLYWHITEDYPGQLFPDPKGEEIHTASLRNWFK